MDCSTSDNCSNSERIILTKSSLIMSQVDLFIWDFDDTLIDTRAYLIRNMTPENIRRRTIKELIEDIPCAVYFKALCNFLVSNGKRVGIASFGTYEIIQAYMDRIFGLNQKIFTRNNIKTINRDCNGVPTEMLKNKNKYIIDLMNFYQLRDFNRVMLFDDRIENCADASMIGVISVKIQGRDANRIEGVARLFDKSTILKVESELAGMCSSRKLQNASNGMTYFDDRKLNAMLNTRCDDETSRNTRISKPMILPVLEGFQNAAEDSNINVIFAISIISIFIITGLLFYKKYI
jgi:hypothetical protein